MKNQIFISYSKKDRDFAWKLADDLTKAGHKVWIDRSLQVGEEWEQTIENQLTEADEVIVVLSGNAIASKWVQHEGSIAYGLRKRMYPILIENIPPENLPIWMSKFQYHSFINVDYEDSFHGLNSVLLPPNPVQDLLELKHFEFKTYQFLIEPKELEIIAVQIENQSLKLSEEDKRLLLFSAAAHGVGERWLTFLGESSLSFLREAVLDGKSPRAVRIGAARCLGAAGDQTAYERLSLAVEKECPGDVKEDLLDSLAVFLHQAPAGFQTPGRLRREMFLRLARLRVKDSVAQRVHLRRELSFIAALCVGVMMTSVYIQSRFSTSASNDWKYYVFVALAFAILGIVVAVSYSEVMTSLIWIIRRWRLAWQIIILFGTGSLIGAILFYLLAGEDGLWFEGGLMGVALALINQKKNHPSSRYTGMTSLLIGFLMFVLTLIAFNEVKQGKPVELLGSALSTGLFAGLYFLAFNRPR